MKLHIISLGCDKNLVDTEHVLGGLFDIEITDDISSADVVAVNTCCFIEESTQESIDAILSACNDKKEGASIVVFGCMAKRYEDQIDKEIPEISLVIPSIDTDTIIRTISERFGIKSGNTGKRIHSFPLYTASIKIAEGCDKHCTYCVIPSIRGSFRSEPMEDLISEAKELADGGVKELVLVAQESCSYGIDLYGKKSLHKLIKKLSEIEGIEWIRLLYAYPEEIYDELIEEMAVNKKFCHYIDMPIQHLDDGILKAMGRRTNSHDIKNLIHKLRDKIPDISIRTTLICGFPGESRKAHENNLLGIKEIGFDNLGAFKYSNEEGAASYHFDNQIDEAEKEKRYDEIMYVQSDIAKQKGFMRVGNIYQCMIEGLVENGIYQARGYFAAADIDSLIFFESDKEYMSGDFINIKITESLGYDLKGEIYESTK